MGASYDYLLSFTDFEKGKHKVSMAGMMMGVKLKGKNYSVTKNTNCIFLIWMKEILLQKQKNVFDVAYVIRFVRLIFYHNNCIGILRAKTLTKRLSIISLTV